MSKLISKRSFLKGFAAAAAGAAAASLVHAKPGAPLPQKWDREADVVILGYGGQVLLLPSQPKTQALMSLFSKNARRAAATQPFPPAA